MVQIINDPGRSGGLGEALGTGLGKGLSSGLQQLAQNKLNLILQNRQRENLVKALTGAGYSQPEANLLSYYPPETQFKIMQMLQPQNELETQTQQNAPNEQQQIQNAKPLEQFNANTDQILESLTKLYNPIDQMVKQKLNAQPIQQIEPTSAENQQKIKNIEKAPREKIASLRGLTPAQRLQEKRDLEAAEMHKAVRKEKAYSMTKQYRENILHMAESSKSNDMRLDRMNELNKKNELQHPLLYSALSKVGLNIPSLQNADTQEFAKLTNDFLKDAKSIFGARVTNYEMAQFLRTIPSLEQTQEGRNRIIRNLKLAGKAAQIKAKAMRDIIKQHNNIPPLDIQERVEDRVGDQLDKISKLFSSGKKIADFSSMQEADPALYAGKTGTDFSTGKKYKSNGKEWIEVA